MRPARCIALAVRALWLTLATLALLVPSPAALAQCVDNDGDGFDSCVDCNDDDPTVYPGAPDNQCNGVDNNCNGKPDSGFKTSWVSCGVGACLGWGRQRCNDGQLTDDCVPKEPTGDDSVCNGKDDNCNGLTDEHYQPEAITCGQGVCVAAGTTACVNGKVVNQCTPGLPTGKDDDCDGVDNNCNGKTDENYKSSWVSCGVGECFAWGRLKCIDAEEVSDCVPGDPAADDSTCDGKDDNCNGLVDEHYVPEVVTCGQGACAATGTTACVNGKVVSQCTPGPPLGNDANCDGVDDNCNGQTDENYKSSWTQCGVGACSAWGKLQCVDAQVVDDCEPGAPVGDDSECNGEDDNCNGLTDENFVGGEVTCGQGVCAATGTQACVNGKVIGGCTPGAPTGNDDDCDGVDDNCNGLTDENYQAPWTQCGEGACASWGKLRCVDAALVDDCEPLPPAGDDANCDGVDDDCNGLTDENFVGQAVSCGRGVCEATGVQECVAGKIVAQCTPGEPTGNDSDCNGQDDNCNGRTDENFKGQWTQCGEGACASWGRLRCVAGDVIDDCTPNEPTGADDDCDGVDDDCNGLTDENYVPAAISCGAGVCEASGLALCVGGKLVHECTPGAPTGADDDCNGVDDNCNGLTDEGYVAPWTSCGVGACLGWGKLRCVAGDLVDDCVPEAPLSETDETCDGVDDNCSGGVDDGVPTEAIECGEGACRAAGLRTCVHGQWQQSCEPLLPLSDTDETCDGVDDNCNGLTDEDFEGALRTCGLGACARTGADVCEQGQVMKTCEPGAPLSDVDDDCDGVDGDCDGKTDEDYAPEPITCGEGPCQASGLRVCEDGAVVDDCTPGSPELADDTCDGVDDNCNGLTDEGYAPVPVSCGVGACQAAGQTACVDGEVVEVCEPGAPLSAVDDTCDGVDDNCNGMVDEDFGVQSIVCGDGACTAPGVASCVGGEVVQSCDPFRQPEPEVCDGTDNDCNGVIDDGAVGVYYHATQGGVEIPMRELRSQMDVVSWYNYEQLYPFSSFTGFERPQRTTVVFHRGPNAALSLVVIHDSPLGSQGGMAMMKIEGLEQGTIVVEDDPAGGVDTYDIQSGSFYWSWSVGTTDGVAIEDIGPNVCLTLTGVVATGTNGFDLAWGTADSQRVSLGSILDPLTVCAVTCCQPGAFDDCNGIDDDCDGLTDEDAAPVPISCGQGGCAAAGQRVCSGGVWVDQCTPGTPAADDATCDGVDDDCDGQTDEDYPQGQIVSCGLGVCRADGEAYCEAGVEVVHCEPLPPASDVDGCNGLDDDCDGETDEDFAPEIVTCGVGACERPALTACVLGEVLESCTPGEPLATSDATCDGVDDDCDGETDEDYLGGATTCGTGACVASGITACVSGVEVTQCEPLPPPSAEDSCDGIDNDCDGLTDEDHVATPTECGLGACSAEGTLACIGGEVVDTCAAGTPAADDSVCNGVDDDCDGKTDEDFAPYTTQCGLGPCAATGVAICVNGALVDDCDPGPPLAALDLTCDGVDDDCDGETDEDYVGAPTSCGVGACAADGHWTCVDGNELDTCVAGTPAADDSVCNGIDDDCDGEIDEDFAPAATQCGLGACARVGKTSCVGGVLLDTCQPGAPLADVDDDCDGVDDDCDGQTDEDFVTTPTTCGVGACAAEGSIACVAGAVVDTCAAGAPAADDSACNGVDDDCDGQTDEDAHPHEVTCGSGPCVATGVATCVHGAWVSDCEPVWEHAAADDATCDGVDDDCDGQTDEDFPTTPTTCTEGPCVGQGAIECVGGEVVDTCVPPVQQPDDATCDGVDDDCDGETDEDYVPREISCGFGPCAAAGVTACVDGKEIELCTPGEPLAAIDDTCDGVDDDCDGIIDDDYVITVVTCGQGACARQGERWCEAGQELESCEPGEPLSDYDDTCDGVDDDCDGQTDEDFVEERITCGVGACRAAGALRCVAGEVTEDCAPGEPSEELCDRTDNDCDGYIDNVSGDAGPTGAMWTVAQGAASHYAPVFAGGEPSGTFYGYDPDTRSSHSGLGVSQRSTFMLYREPSGELSLIIVNDARQDGSGGHLILNVDGFVQGTIAAGDDPDDPQDHFDVEGGYFEWHWRACCTDGVAVHHVGEGLCITVTVESAEGIDGFDFAWGLGPDQRVSLSGGLTEPLTLCPSVCEDTPPPIDCWSAGLDPRTTPESVCLPLSCPAPPWADTDETCDGIDDDCDGQTDEDFASGPIVCGLGECLAFGQATCVDGVVVDHCEDAGPVAEVCDGLDNDCNGLVDDGLPSQPTTCGLGACASVGIKSCEGGAWVDSCVPGPALSSSDDGCDGVDADCDGQTDEDYAPVLKSCGVGACASQGPTQCVAGQVVSTCTPGLPTAEVCDGLDNDCNGLVDDGLEPEPTSCGVGACARTGEQICQFGVPTDTCKPGFPASQDATCDGIDDDCDGETDEDWAPPEHVCGGDPALAECVDGQIVAQCEVCDGTDNDGNGLVDDGVDGSYLSVTQGEVSFAIDTVRGGADVADFYGYHTSVPFSSATGFEASNRASLLIHEDPSGTMSLVVLFDAARDGSGGRARLRIDGLEQGEIAVHDDPPGGADRYRLDQGFIEWRWNACCTDGVAIAQIGDDFCLTLQLDRVQGLDGVDIVSGPNGHQRTPLPSLDEPFTICRVTCCTPDPGGEVCDGKDNDCNGLTDEGLTGLAVQLVHGDLALDVEPIQGDSDVIAWYSYGSPLRASANTGLEQSDTTVLALHEDPSGVRSLVVIHDAARDGSGGKMVMHLEGLTGAEVVFIDDPRAATDRLDRIAGVAMWTWYACCTDGMVLGQLADEFCYTLYAPLHQGITKFAFASGDGTITPLPVPTKTQPLSLCSIRYCLDAPPGSPWETPEMPETPETPVP